MGLGHHLPFASEEGLILWGRRQFRLVLTIVYSLLVSVPLSVLVAQWRQVKHFPFVPLMLKQLV